MQSQPNCGVCQEQLQEAERWLGFVERVRTALESLGGIKAMEESALRDLLRLATDRSRRFLVGADGNGRSTAREPRSIFEHLADFGIDEVRARPIARIAERLYRQRHGRSPEKITRRIDGRLEPVSAFGSADFDLVQAAVVLELREKALRVKKRVRR
jgi:hypothetical protein